MINNRILHLINAPEDIRALDIENLQKVIGDYPYVQSFRALYLIALNKFNSDKYQSELTITAAYTTDKKILYQLLSPINDTLKSNDYKEETKDEASEDNSLEKIESIFKGKVDLIKDETEINLESSVSEIKINNYNKQVEEKELNIENDLNIEKKIDLEIERNDSIKSYEELTDWNPMDIHISTSNALIDQVVAHKDDIEIIEEQNKIKYHISTNESNVETKFPIKTISKSVENVSDDSSNVSLFINTWTNWLHKQKPKNIITSEIDKKEAIIDKFIENSPKISVIKENIDYVVKDKGENISHLMTETLADLYVEQKIYTKAIEAFKVLQEKCPERSEYFGEKIKYIKDLQADKIQSKDL